MAGFLDRFRKNVMTSVWKDDHDIPPQVQIDDKIALGVLLWIVAEADNKFLPEEEEKIKDILLAHAKITQKDLALILASVKEAHKQRVDLYRFTNEVSKNLSYQVKMNIIEDLFRIACVDKDLDTLELETIRQIAGLFDITHKDFIDTKIKIKKEFGLKVAEF